MKRQVFNWLIGILLSSFVGWIIALVCVDSTTVYTYNEQLKRWIHPKGNHYLRKEGWAKSQIGALGITGIDDVRLETRPKVILWGDSHVEGFYLSDDEKMAQKVTALFTSRFQSDTMGVGFALSSQTVADYVFQIQAIEEMLSNIIAHVIVVTDISDISPSDLIGRHSIRANFLAKPHYHIEKSRWVPPDLNKSQFFLKYRLNSIRRAFGNVRHKMESFHFKPGPVRKIPQKKQPEPSLEDLFPAWEYLMKTLIGKTQKPLYVVYAPAVPVLNSGKVDYIDQKEIEFKAFETVCKKNNINFINLETQLNIFFKETHVFPRGFFNSPPGTGHLNRHGHQLVAEMIVSAVSKQREMNRAFLEN